MTVLEQKGERERGPGMAHLNPGRPAESEYQPLYAGHVRRVPEGNIIDILDRQMAGMEQLLPSYTDARAAWRPAPGEWNAIEIVGHLADIERVHAFRALSFAREDPAPLPGMNPTGYMAAAGFAHRPLADVASEYFAVRRATLALYRGLDAAAWNRSGSANEMAVSVRAIAYIIAGHELLHRADLDCYPALADQSR